LGKDGGEEGEEEEREEEEEGMGRGQRHGTLFASSLVKIVILIIE
jgi:hypothetical protein